MTSFDDDHFSHAPRRRGPPARASNYPGMVIHGVDTRALSPEEKGEILKSYVKNGSPLVIDVPGVYYPPAQLHEHPRWERIDFTGANLRGAKLAREVILERFHTDYAYRDHDEIIEIQGPNLKWVQLDGADLGESDLRRANLREALLIGANMRGCNLEGADLSDANLDRADLCEANLQGATLEGASFKDAQLTHCNLLAARISVETFQRSFWNVDMATQLIKNGALFVGLNQFPEEIRHLLFGESFGNDLRQRIHELKERLQQLEIFHARARQAGGVFISYAHADAVFVTRLVERLEGDGFIVWRDEKEILVGDVIDRVISEGIQRSWLFLVVLTPASIGSQWVAREIDEAVHEEVQGRKIVLPVLAGGLVLDQLPARMRRKRCAVFGTGFEPSYNLLKSSITTHLARHAVARESMVK